MVKNIRILIIRLSSIGDVLLTTPLIRVLRNKYHDLEIDFLTYDTNKQLLSGNVNLTNILTIPKAMPVLEARKILRNRKYDIIIDLQHSLKSGLIRFGRGGKVYKFNKRRLYKLKLVWFKKRSSQFDLIPDLYIDTVKKLDLWGDDSGLEFPLDNDIGKSIGNNPKKVSNLIGIAPGAYHYTKRWPVEKFIELIKQINDKRNVEYYFLGGSSDIETCEKICATVKNAKSFAGKTSLKQTAELIDKCSVVVTNDTSIMHIAAARKIPCVAIFGSTVQEFGFVPYKSKHKIIENETPCRPCTHYGRNKCPKKHFKCMVDIQPEEVMNETLKMINIE